jgi:hypothetical protein
MQRDKSGQSITKKRQAEICKGFIK